MTAVAATTPASESVGSTAAHSPYHAASVPPPPPQNHHNIHHHKNAGRRTGPGGLLLRAMLQRFSSTPLQCHDDHNHSNAHANANTNNADANKADPVRKRMNDSNHNNHSNSNFLTDSERHYLETLLLHGDDADMDQASQVLSDASVFFDPTHETKTNHDDTHDHTTTAHTHSSSSSSNRPWRRDSWLQQQLYKLHETATTTHKKKNKKEKKESGREEEEEESQEAANDAETATHTASAENDEDKAHHCGVRRFNEENDDDLNSILSWGSRHPNKDQELDTTLVRKNDDAAAVSSDAPAAQKDLSYDDDDESVIIEEEEDLLTWLGNHKKSRNATASSTPSSWSWSLSNPTPFLILGTRGSDTTCHPHVLTPPLMEALLHFVPEETTTNGVVVQHFWLKYSLVRDGGGLLQLLRQCRASPYTFVAVETTHGQVLGSFTSSAWRCGHSSNHTHTTLEDHDNDDEKEEEDGWYGGSANGGMEGQHFPASFLWKMRHPRMNHVSTQTRQQQQQLTQRRRSSIARQVCQESEIQVFPLCMNHSNNNQRVQYCSLTHGIRIGRGELLFDDLDHPDGHHSYPPNPTMTGEHYGYGLALQPSLWEGSTSTSESFGNPALLTTTTTTTTSTHSHHEPNVAVRGETFDVANVEVWTLTPHTRVELAEEAEFRALFGYRSSTRTFSSFCSNHNTSSVGQL